MSPIDVGDSPRGQASIRRLLTTVAKDAIVPLAFLTTGPVADAVGMRFPVWEVGMKPIEEKPRSQPEAAMKVFRKR